MGNYLGSSPIKIIKRSRNLIPFPYNGDSRPSGITYSVNYDGSITVNGKNDGSNASTYFLARNVVLPAGTYILSANIPDGYTYITVIISGKYYFAVRNKPLTLSFEEETTISSIYIQVEKTSPYLYDNYRFEVMLNEGETALPYEPYNQLWRVRSGALIRNPKNVLQVKDYTNTYGGVTVTVKDNKLTAVGTAIKPLEIWLPLEYPLAKGTYSSILGVEKTLYGTGVNSLGLSPSDRDFDNRKSFAKDSSNSINNITTTFLANYMSLYIALGNTVDCSVDLMLNEGDTAEPYFVYD